MPDRHAALTELTRNDLLIRGDLQSVFARITEVAAKVMGAERVSIWRFANDPAALRCSDMYDSATGLHDSGVELKFEDFPIHFAALQRGELIAAADASTHPLTCELAPYLTPLGIASIMDVGASGGYYIASAADRILAHPSTVTGSIGVIMLTVNAHGLLEKVGVEATAITSGPRKDMGSPFRVMTPEERGIFQALIDSFYQRFLSVVQDGRPNLQMEQIKKLADGRIYTGDQAKAAGLVDEIGYLEEAIDAAKKKAGLTEAKVVTYRRPGDYSNNIYTKLMAPSPLAALGNLDVMAFVRGGAPQFMYLWMP